MYIYAAHQQRDPKRQEGKSVRDYFLKELTVGIDVSCNIYTIYYKTYLYSSTDMYLMVCISILIFIISIIKLFYVIHMI